MLGAAWLRSLKNDPTLTLPYQREGMEAFALLKMTLASEQILQRRVGIRKFELITRL